MPSTMTSVRAAGLAGVLSFVALGGAPLTPASAEMTVEVGGAPMRPSRSIIENAVNSKDHTTLIAALEAAGLVETLQGEGPFTVFAPVNKAFEKLPKGAVDELLKPENKAALTAVLTYHIVAGKYSSADFVAAIKKGGGKAMFKTMQGDELTIEQDGRKLEILDSKGDRAIVTIADVNQRNGVIHIVDTVLLPKT